MVAFTKKRILVGEIDEGDTIEIGTDHRGMIEFVTKKRPDVVR